MTITVEHPDPKSPAVTSFNGPLFVLSVWRSGSSLLYALLNQHSQISLLYEGDLPHLHRFLRGSFHNGSWRERWEFWNQGPSRHGIAIESLPANVADAWEATRVVYQEVARRKDATIWGEKTPHWYDCPLSLADKFPDARFIFLWRDVNAVLRSIASAARTEHFFRKPGFTEKVLLGTENLRQAYSVLKARGRPVHEVNYEDLVSNPSSTMQHTCQFLKVPFQAHMASLAGADRSAIASGQHHNGVRSDKIVGETKREEVLSVALQKKINGYICRWKERYDGKWPKYPLVVPVGTQPPSLSELWRDRIAYQAVLGQDYLIAGVYSIVPLAFARGIRSWSRQRGPKSKLLPMSQ